MPKETRQSLADLLLAWTPFFVVFVVIPIAIYVPNQIEFEYELFPIVIHIAIGVLTIIPLLALMLFKTEIRGRIAAALFFLGLFLLLSDMIAPLQWGEFNGDEKLIEPRRLTLLQAGLAIVLIGVWYLAPTKLVRTVGVPIVCTLLAFQLVELGRAGVAAAATVAAAPGEPDNNSASSEERPNIYHFVFDAYSSLIFLDNLDALDLRKELTGFTFFPRTLANYPSTDSSVPSFMTGRFFKEGSFRQFQLDAKRGGFRHDLQKAGYEISIYSPDRSRAWSYDRANHFMTGQDVARQLVGGSDAVARLAQITFVRVAPNFLRKETFAASGAFFAMLAAPTLELDGVSANYTDYRYYKFLSVPVVRRFIADEAERPSSNQYVYLHVVLPHLPQMWDADCKLTQGGSNAQVAYEAQALCATKLMGEIVAELKKLGRYDNSIIAFQSDHGMNFDLGEPGPKPAPLSSEAAARLNETNSYHPPVEYFQRLLALLAIKQPFETGPLEVSQTQTQLADIAATFSDLTDIDSPPTDGVSVFSPLASTSREIHVFTGLHFKSPTGELGILGRSGVLAQKLREIELAHFSYSDQGWRVYPNLPAAW